VGRQLRVSTIVPISGGDGFKIYGPEDDVPKEHAALIGEHAWVDGSEGGDAGDPSVEPPRSGAGSGKEAWAAFAAQAGHDPEGKSRDEIVKMLADAGVVEA